MGYICGKVEEELGDNDTGDAPLVGVFIIPVNPNTADVIITTDTDSTGSYCFEDLPIGMYTITETNSSRLIDVSDVDGPNDSMITVIVLPGDWNVIERSFVDEK